MPHSVESQHASLALLGILNVRGMLAAVANKPKYLSGLIQEKLISLMSKMKVSDQWLDFLPSSSLGALASSILRTDV